MLQIVAWLAVALFSLTGLSKLISLPASIAERDRLDVSKRKWYTVGTLEVLGAAAVAGVLADFAPRGVGVAAAWGFILLMLGAMGMRLSHGPREKQRDWMLILDVLVFALAVATLIAMLHV